MRRRHVAATALQAVVRGHASRQLLRKQLEIKLQQLKDEEQQRRIVARALFLCRNAVSYLAACE